MMKLGEAVRSQCVGARRRTLLFQAQRAGLCEDFLPWSASLLYVLSESKRLPSVGSARVAEKLPRA